MSDPIQIQCSKCKHVGPPEDYAKRLGGKAKQCKYCRSKSDAAHKERDVKPEAREQRRNRLKKHRISQQSAITSGGSVSAGSGLGIGAFVGNGSGSRSTPSGIIGGTVGGSISSAGSSTGFSVPVSSPLSANFSGPALSTPVGNASDFTPGGAVGGGSTSAGSRSDFSAPVPTPIVAYVSGLTLSTPVGDVLGFNPGGVTGGGSASAGSRSGFGTPVSTPAPAYVSGSTLSAPIGNAPGFTLGGPAGGGRASAGSSFGFGAPTSRPLLANFLGSPNVPVGNSSGPLPGSAAGGGKTSAGSSSGFGASISTPTPPYAWSSTLRAPVGALFGNVSGPIPHVPPSEASLGGATGSTTRYLGTALGGSSPGLSLPIGLYANNRPSDDSTTTATNNNISSSSSSRSRSNISTYTGNIRAITPMPPMNDIPTVAASTVTENQSPGGASAADNSPEGLTGFSLVAADESLGDYFSMATELLDQFEATALANNSSQDPAGDYFSVATELLDQLEATAPADNSSQDPADDYFSMATELLDQLEAAALAESSSQSPAGDYFSMTTELLDQFEATAPADNSSQGPAGDYSWALYNPLRHYRRPCVGVCPTDIYNPYGIYSYERPTTPVFSTSTGGRAEMREPVSVDATNPSPGTISCSPGAEGSGIVFAAPLSKEELGYDPYEWIQNPDEDYIHDPTRE